MSKTDWIIQTGNGFFLHIPDLLSKKFFCKMFQTFTSTFYTDFNFTSTSSQTCVWHKSSPILSESISIYLNQFLSEFVMSVSYKINIIPTLDKHQTNNRPTKKINIIQTSDKNLINSRQKSDKDYTNIRSTWKILNIKNVTYVRHFLELPNNI